MTDLKPCPFCGKPHEARVVTASEVWDEPSNGPFPNDESYSVMCDASTENGERGCGSASGYFISERQAIAAWNRRSDGSLSDAQAEIARLRGALERCREAFDSCTPGDYSTGHVIPPILMKMP